MNALLVCIHLHQDPQVTVLNVVMAHIPMLFISQHVLNVLLEHILIGIQT
jgi:hypothetical protein